MLTLNATSTPNFYDVLSSNLWDHYGLLVKADNSMECTCPVYYYYGYCYHILEAKKQVTFMPEPLLPATAPFAIPVEGTDGHQVNCSCCGAWMMKWAWEKHLRGNFCEMYLSEKKGAAAAAPAPVLVPSVEVGSYPLAA